MEDSIKKIHYCWFGNGEKSKLMKKCIYSWRKFFPDYEIIEWNENNFDINSNTYVKEAYNNKKYAFVSDYVRMYVLNKFGGIYFDTDIEIVRDFRKIIEKNKMIITFEMDNVVMTGMIYCNSNNKILKDILEFYEESSFIGKNGKLNTIPNTVMFTKYIENEGIKMNGKFQDTSEIKIFPNEYFCAFDMKNTCYNITGNTYCIHHYTGSWCTPFEKFSSLFKRFIGALLGKKNVKNIRKLKNLILRNKKEQ